ncbi:MAG TPA: YdeI/OmpD-associated family protein [Qipengyuania sp.]|nr:YdeI/OmpD-associated family protein [Qipengyuania sp.]
MPSTDPRIDAYIAKSAPFAQPILTHLRALVHRAAPEAEEGIKWGMPHFMVGGKNVAGFAAFKAHCAFVIHGDGRQGEPEAEGMGGYGKIAALSDLPDDSELEGKVREAAQRVATSGTALKPKARKSPKPEIAMPEDFAKALAAEPKARAVLEGFAPGQRRDYLEWITEAKQPATRERRIAQAVEWLAEGKKRHWKYESC